MSHVELFSEENNARQGRKDGFHAHQDAESLRGELLEGDDFQPIGQRRGKDAEQQSQRENGHGEHGRPRRGYAEGQDGAGPDDHAERDGCAASGVPCPLAEKDVHGPAESGSEREGHAHGIEIAGKFVNGQQQEQAADSQRNPQEVDEAARTEHGYRQRPGELQRHAHAQRDAADGLIEAHVHDARGQAVEDDGQPLLAGELRPPRAHYRKQDQRREHKAQGRRRLGADDRKNGLGERRAALDRQHRYHQQRYGEEGRRCGHFHGARG